jgi:adenylate kinase family enzyme
VPPASSTPPASRILVYGVTGSGKTTAAREIAARTGLPLVEVDELCWRPGWVQLPEQEMRELLGRVAAQDRWVLDSAWGIWLDLVLPRAELVVGLDYPRWFSLQRLVRRTVARAADKRPVCNGNTESWRQALGGDSIVRWHFRSFAGKRERLRGWAAAADGPAVLLFRRPRDLERWLRRLGNRPAGCDVRSP